MKVFKVSSMIEGSGEYILGAEQTGSHACYLIYGRMVAGEKGRVLRPGGGHEEIFLAVRGDFRLSGEKELVVKEGEAVHLKGEETFHAENITDSEAVYVMAGGHSEGGHH